MINGLGILGYDCYTNTTLESNLMIQSLEVSTTGYYIDEDMENQVSIFNSEDCRVGDVKLFLYTDYAVENNFKGLFEFEDIDSVLHVLLESPMNSNMTESVDEFIFPTGLIFEANLYDANELQEMELYGQMSWYGINSTGEITVFMSNDSALLVMNLPLFSIGSGNVQFLRASDLSEYYMVTDEDDINDIISEDMPDSQIEEGYNTLTVNITVGETEQARVVLDSNVYMFSMYYHVISTLISDQLHFTIPGRPFGGIFNASSTVSVTLVEDLQNEDNSVVEIIIQREENFDELETRVNDVLYEWIRNIVYTYERLQYIGVTIEEDRDEIQLTYVPQNQCNTYSQCVSEPYINCQEQMTEIVCVLNETSCEIMQQECTVQRQE